MTGPTRTRHSDAVQLTCITGPAQPAPNVTWRVTLGERTLPLPSTVENVKENVDGSVEIESLLVIVPEDISDGGFDLVVECAVDHVSDKEGEFRTRAHIVEVLCE